MDLKYTVVFDFKKILYFVIDIFLKLLAILLPVVSLVAGATFISFEILHYFQRVLHISGIEPNPFNYFIGFFLFILSILLILLVVKTKSIYYFAVFLLILNGIFIFGVILFLMTPTLDFFVEHLLFQKGFCTLLDQSAKMASLNQEATETKNQFCASASKLFRFDYPTKYSY